MTLEPSTIAFLTAATRAVAYTASTLIVGVAVFDAAVLGRASLRETDRDTARSRARTVGQIAAIGLLFAYAARLYIQVIDSYLVAVPTVLMLNQLFFLTRAWGHGVLGQLVISSLLVVFFFYVRRRTTTPPALLWIAASLAALSVPLTGHAASHGGTAALAVQSAHVFAAGSWLGTLAVLWLVCRNAVDTVSLVSIIGAFSPVALTSAPAIAVAGIAAFFIHVGSLQALISTGYGAVLLVKIALFVTAAGVGYVNWRHVTPDLARGGPRGQFTRAAALEISLGVMAVLATALLTSLQKPGE